MAVTLEQARGGCREVGLVERVGLRETAVRPAVREVEAVEAACGGCRVLGVELHLEQRRGVLPEVERHALGVQVGLRLGERRRAVRGCSGRAVLEVRVQRRHAVDCLLGVKEAGRQDVVALVEHSLDDEADAFRRGSEHELVAVARDGAEHGYLAGVLVVGHGA